MTSIQPRKQRKALYNAPLHRRGKHMHAHLSEELLVKYGRRAFPVRVGDTVRVVRGKARGTVGKVLSIDRRGYTLNVDEVTIAKADGTKKPKPVHPSDVILTKLDLTDKLRREKIGASEADVEPAAPKPAKKAAGPKGGPPRPGRPEPESSPKARAEAKEKMKEGAAAEPAAPEDEAEDLDEDEAADETDEEESR
jgi:large subunit ribosomal protein L24